jgi:hypothetical protein
MSSNFQVVELKSVIQIGLHIAPKKGELKNEGKSVEVIENKYRKNVNFLVCVEVDENRQVIHFLCGC